MSDQEPPSKGYVVRDRRRFESDGTPRESEAPIAEVVHLQTGARAAEPRAALRTEPARASAPPPQPARPAPAPPPPAAGAPAASGGSSRARRAASEELDFSQVVLSLATNAVVALEGSGPDGRVPGGRPNLAIAEQNIAILIILEEKTRGNLSEEEQQLLKSVLYDLRMQFVAVAQALEGPR